MVDFTNWISFWSKSPQPPAAVLASPPTPSPPPRTPKTEPPPQTQHPTRRLLRQLGLPLMGGTFLLLSVGLTRRSLVRRLQPPKFYRPNTQPPEITSSGALDALEALQLASLNVASFAIFLVGGVGFALDVSSLQELREKAAFVRGDGENEAEKEMEEWMVEVLARKEVKERAKRMAEV